MKLQFIFLFICCMGIYAENIHSQDMKISIVSRNASIKDILGEIEEKTDYLFLYNQDEIDVTQQSSIHADNEMVSDLLTNLFDDTNIKYTMVGNHIILMKNEELTKYEKAGSQQNKQQISGIVTDKTGEPIIGANILEKGTTNGVVTDIDGRFIMHVSGSSTLQISYIGYITQEISVGNQSQISVTLQEDYQNLEEVVVIGYGTVKKSDLTGSITTVSAKDFNRGISRSPDQLLAGKVPGLMINRSSGDPTAGVTMQLRGPSSLTASTTPFYVIDGVPGASINLVSPDDIESMNVLKDASATAI